MQKKKTIDTSDVQFTVSKNGINIKRGTCVICGTTKTQSIKAQDGELLLNKSINNLPFETYLTGHNFTGPGTKFKKQLNPDLKNDDTATRNAMCNKNMLKEVDGIYNPSLWERLDKSIVSKLIRTKVKFGIGVKKKSSGRITQTYKKKI